VQRRPRVGDSPGVCWEWCGSGNAVYGNKHSHALLLQHAHTIIIHGGRELQSQNTRGRGRGQSGTAAARGAARKWRGSNVAKPATAAATATWKGRGGGRRSHHRYTHHTDAPRRVHMPGPHPTPPFQAWRRLVATARLLGAHAPPHTARLLVATANNRRRRRINGEPHSPWLT
jgi:hypothetical protein